MDQHLPAYEDGMRVDVWWNKVRQSDKYPVLSKVVLALCTIFHGPTVESCFNIINPRTSRMSISLYNAYQTVKYHLHAHGKSAVQFFHRANVEFSPVDPDLVRNMSTASSMRTPASNSEPLESKAAAKRRMDAEATSDRASFCNREAPAGNEPSTSTNASTSTNTSTSNEATSREACKKRRKTPVQTMRDKNKAQLELLQAKRKSKK